MQNIYANLKDFDPEYYVKTKIISLHTFFQKNNRSTLVIGISGGVDSAVSAALLVELAKTYPDSYVVKPVFAPIFNSEGTTEQLEALTLSNIVCKHLNLKATYFSLGGVSDSYTEALDIETPYIQQQVDYWLRPTAFYKVAMQNEASILVSTVNNTEWMLGWFSQYLDILGVHPVIDINKQQVYELASYLGIPAVITQTPPKGGLADGSTDEDALGFTYDNAWSYLHDPEKLPQNIKELISKRISESEFKRDRFNPSFIFSTAILPQG